MDHSPSLWGALRGDVQLHSTQSCLCFTKVDTSSGSHSELHTNPKIRFWMTWCPAEDHRAI